VRPGLAGPAQSIGPGKEKQARGKKGRSGMSLRMEFSNFCFSKILNSTSFCLFHCELFRAPKMIKIFVCYLGKI
jgi:hypothetical protein